MDWPARILSGFTVGLLTIISALAAAQDHPIRLIQETYFRAGSSSRGLQHTANWTELHADLGPAWSTTISDFDFSGSGMLDETFLQYSDRSSSFRLGRMRSGFGFGSWSDLWYEPVINAPICRFMPLADGVNLINFNSGLELKHWRGNVQTELAAVDTSPANEQILPDKLRFVRARIQVADGSMILGLNGLARHADLSSDSARVVGVDYRWTAPRLVSHGEAMEGFGSGITGKGFYADVSYRPPKFFRSELAARIEGYKSLVASASLYTLGLRQIVTSNLALSLNYSWGNVPDFLYSSRGWHLQTALGVRFQ